ncbi:MAG: hypothetical protein FWC77_06905 [Defluviitaleaceae bacterium]|nr:hypothetical protein [Defluviitaleaceae bacterium]
MASVGMVGQNGREMARAFLRMCQGTASCYHITEDQQQGPKLDILVASEASPVLAELVPKMAPESYLVANADDKEIFPYLSPRKAKLITYGFNNKACVTASSVTDDGLHICIQRSFTTLDGAIRDPQEFAAPIGSSLISPDVALGAAAVYAICGRM